MHKEVENSLIEYCEMISIPEFAYTAPDDLARLSKVARLAVVHQEYIRFSVFKKYLMDHISHTQFPPELSDESWCVLTTMIFNEYNKMVKQHRD